MGYQCEKFCQYPLHRLTFGHLDVLEQSGNSAFANLVPLAQDAVQTSGAKGQYNGTSAESSDEREDEGKYKLICHILAHQFEVIEGPG